MSLTRTTTPLPYYDAELINQLHSLISSLVQIASSDSDYSRNLQFSFYGLGWNRTNKVITAVLQTVKLTTCLTNPCVKFYLYKKKRERKKWKGFTSTFKMNVES
jgi:hypothetical protein